MTQIRCPVNEASDTSRHEPALITENRKIIYSEYDQYLAATAQRLRQAGCRAGDRVGLALPDGWPLAVLLLSLFRLPAAACLLDPSLSPEELKQWGSRLGCRRLITAADADAFVTLFAGEPLSEERVHLDLGQPATVVLPEGPAGRVVQHSFGSHYYGALGANHNSRSTSGSRWLAAAPLHRPEGVAALIQSALSGAAVVLPGAGESIEDAIGAYGVTHVALSPAQLEALLGRGFDRKRCAGLRAAILLGRELPTSLLERGRAAGLPLFPAYALAEMASPVAMMKFDSPPQKRGTSGVVLKYREVRIATDGEILVRGRPLFDGYVEAGAVRNAVDADGWFATGDLGRLDSDGYLAVTGSKPGRR